MALSGLYCSSAIAAEPKACAPTEDVIVCELKIERNNAMDELAMNAGMLRRETETSEKLAEYWREYVAGINAQAEWWKSYADGSAKKEKHRVW